MTDLPWPQRLEAALPAFREREQSDPERYPAETIDDLRRLGLFEAPLPNGSRRRATLGDMVAAVEAIATASPSAALLVTMPVGIAGIHGEGAGVAPAQFRDAYAAQCQWVAEEIRSGAIFAAANSERGAGGNVAATKTTATRRADGDWTLSGEKILGSFGRHAKYFISTGKVTQEDLPGAGVVEIFFMPTDGTGVTILDDWDGFGMRSTESHTVRYADAPAVGIMGFPDFIAVAQPLTYWFHLFAAVPLGVARRMLAVLSTPAPASPALRLRLSEALMRYEATRAYLLSTAAEWHLASDAVYRARVLRVKTYVTQESTRLAGELFALSGGRHYRRGDELARLLAASYAGTALRPPLALGLDGLVDSFEAGLETLG